MLAFYEPFTDGSLGSTVDIAVREGYVMKSRELRTARFLVRLLLVLVFAVCVAACGQATAPPDDDDDDDGGGGGGGPSPVVVLGRRVSGEGVRPRRRLRIAMTAP